jgi:transposase
VAQAGSAIQRMQKAMTEMNIQLSNVLTDLSGVSGMKIIGAMLDGERDSWALAPLVEPGVKATPEDIAKSLEGNWREELLFVLTTVFTILCSEMLYATIAHTGLQLELAPSFLPLSQRVSENPIGDRQ